MKKFVFAALVIAIAFSASASDVIKRGAAISPDAKSVTAEQIVEKPDAYSKKPVVVEGVVSSVCTNMGCWMQLDSVRVTFKDYGFFVPTDSKGMQVRAFGIAKVRKISKDEADHLEGEGAKLNRNPDGTANEVAFVASGVELRK